MYIANEFLTVNLPPHFDALRNLANKYIIIKPIRLLPQFWINKTIPAYFDESLSYLEMLGILLGKVEEIKELHQKEPISDTLTSSWKYFLSRIKSIYPFYFAAVGFFCILNIILKHTKLLNSILYFISDLLFLQIFRFPSISYTGTVWFLAALFFSLFVLYPIVRRYYDVYIKYFSLPIVLLNMGYVMRIFHSFDGWSFD